MRNRIPCDTPSQLRTIIADRTAWAKEADEKDLHGTAKEWRLTIELAKRVLILEFGESS